MRPTRATVAALRGSIPAVALWLGSLALAQTPASPLSDQASLNQLLPTIDAHFNAFNRTRTYLDSSTALFETVGSCISGRSACRT